MPICTYLNDAQYTNPTTDEEINTLLAEVRERTREDWRVCERITTKRRLFRKPVVSKSYQLLIGIGGPEFQWINFYVPEHNDTPLGSINVCTSAGYVAAYLYGMLGVLDSDKRAPNPQETP